MVTQYEIIRPDFSDELPRGRVPATKDLGKDMIVIEASEDLVEQREEKTVQKRDDAGSDLEQLRRLLVGGATNETRKVVDGLNARVNDLGIELRTRTEAIQKSLQTSETERRQGRAEVTEALEQLNAVGVDISHQKSNLADLTELVTGRLGALEQDVAEVRKNAGKISAIAERMTSVERSLEAMLEEASVVRSISERMDELQHLVKDTLLEQVQELSQNVSHVRRLPELLRDLADGLEGGESAPRLAHHGQRAHAVQVSTNDIRSIENQDWNRLVAADARSQPLASESAQSMDVIEVDDDADFEVLQEAAADRAYR
jgi:uncharacterized phage infection (PIP) family protein YhgE